MDEDLTAPLEHGIAKYDALGWPRPKVALVSGSGLAVDLGEPVAAAVDLQELLPFAVEGIVGHPLRVELLMPAAEQPVLYFRGRLHSYQGFSAAQTVLPVRLARLLGATTLVMTNATGGVRQDLGPGDLVLIEDHVNLIGMNPLRGRLPVEWGPQFPDMVTAYDPELRALAREHAEHLGVPLTAGVYAGVAGPSYETPAEVRMLRTLGADVTGMSTVLEVIAARHMGMRCLCFSLVTNAAAGVTGEPLDHEEVLAASRDAAARVQRLLTALVADPRLV
jgi:purine-nucleoside phosphorylase